MKIMLFSIIVLLFCILFSLTIGLSNIINKLNNK